MSEEEHIVRKYDIVNGTRVRILNKNKLIENLKADGIVNPSGTKKQIRELCVKRGLPFSVTERKVKEGWCNKQKGAIQVLFKCEWLDPQNILLYTADGKKDAEKNPNFLVNPTGCHYSLMKLMNKQSNFINELTLLQYH